MNPSPCTCFKVRSLARRLTQLYDATLAPSGLRSTQFSLLAHARRPRGGEAPGVSALAAQLNTDRTTLTRNLRPMVEAGWVRLAGGADARRKAVSVTAEGEAAFQQARTLWRAAQARVRELGGAEPVAQLESLIDALMPRLADGAEDEAGGLGQVGQVGEGDGGSAGPAPTGGPRPVVPTGAPAGAGR